LNLKGEQRAERELLVKRIQELDLLAESRLLSFLEWDERINLENKIERLDNLEEKVGFDGGFKHPLLPSIFQWEKEEEHYCFS